MRSIAFLVSSLLLALLLVAQTNAALAQPKLSYVLKSAKLALSTVDGSSRLSKEFSTHSDYSKNNAPFDLASPTQLENDDVIRLTFSLGVEGQKVANKDGPALGKEHVPHQAFVVLASQSDETVSHAWPVAVKPSTGKVSWNLVSQPMLFLVDTSCSSMLEVTYTRSSYRFFELFREWTAFQQRFFVLNRP